MEEELQRILEELYRAYLAGNPYLVDLNFRELELFLLEEEQLLQHFSLEEIWEEHTNG